MDVRVLPGVSLVSFGGGWRRWRFRLGLAGGLGQRRDARDFHPLEGVPRDLSRRLQRRIGHQPPQRDGRATLRHYPAPGSSPASCSHRAATACMTASSSGVSATCTGGITFSSATVVTPRARASAVIASDSLATIC